MSRTISNLLLSGAAAAGAALAASQPAVAQPLDAYSYKASHNSYERDEPLWYQVVVQNCWGIELDLCWHSDEDRPVVRHMADGPEPCLLPSRGPLSDWLDELLYRDRIWERLTFVYLDIHSYDCLNPISSDCLDWTPERKAALIDLLDAYIPRANVYTRANLEQDDWKWPSPQELLRRGKRFVIFINQSSWDFSGYFHEQRWSPVGAPSYVSLINRDNASLVDDREPVPGDRFMWRTYPGLDAVIFEDEDLDHFQLGVARGFNIVSCNFLDRDWTYQFGTMPPMPMHVRRPLIPDPTPVGTYEQPFDNLHDAVERIELTDTQGQPRTEPFPISLHSVPASIQPIYYVGHHLFDPDVPIRIQLDPWSDGPVYITTRP